MSKVGGRYIKQDGTTIGTNISDQLALVNPLHDGQTLQNDGINSDGGAFNFTTTGDITFNKSLVLADGEFIGIDSGPQIVFDDTLNYIEITGGNVGIGLSDPAQLVEIAADSEGEGLLISGTDNNIDNPTITLISADWNTTPAGEIKMLESVLNFGSIIRHSAANPYPHHMLFVGLASGIETIVMDFDNSTGDVEFPNGDITIGDGAFIGTTGPKLYFDSTANDFNFSGGYVGVGNSTPYRLLHVGSIGLNANAYLMVQSAGGYKSSIEFLGGGSGIWAAGHDDGAGTKPFNIDYNGSIYFSITSDGRVGINNTAPATSALLDLASTTGALLVPRMTTTQRNALTAVNGMIIYNSTDNQFNFYENSSWVTK